MTGRIAGTASEADPIGTFDPHDPQTWPKGLDALLKSNVPSTAEIVEAYLAWRELAWRERGVAPASAASGASTAPAVGKISVYTTNKRRPHLPPGKSREWLLDKVKTMPGGRKVVRDWQIASVDYEAWLTEQDAARVRASAPNRRVDADARAIAESTLAKAGMRPTKGAK